jgi:sugar lactone lactonase YvrE
VPCSDSRPAHDLRSGHAEGPLWDTRSSQLLWVDQYDGLVQVASFEPATATLRTRRTYQVGHPVGAIVPARAGGWMLAGGPGFVHLSPDGVVTPLAEVEADEPRTRMNDGKCDPRGQFWAGTMAWDKTPRAGALYRLNHDLTTTVTLQGVTISNGLAWSGDGTQLYYIDTPTRAIDRFSLTEDGALSARTTVIRIDEGAGDPDGMCIDDEGCLWVALWGGHAVRRYSPAGELLDVVEVDAPLVSSCCLGGPDMRTLFITTSQEDMSPADRAAHPHSGKIFCAEVAVPGPPAADFAGAVDGRQSP